MLKMHIILVEDNDNTAFITELYLEKSGIAERVDRTYRIKPFESLVNVNKYDLALIDYHLQAFDAPEFIKIIKASGLNARTPIIVTSHELSRGEEDEIKALGVQYIRRHDDYSVFMGLIFSAIRRMN
jgi:DNA-binding response OmpR family regulator